MFCVKIVIIFTVLIAKILNFDEISPLPSTTPAATSGHDETAEETEHAICKIITQEIQTSANATVKRQLKGVCTTNQIERKFRQLERKLLLELGHIKTMLSNDRTATIKTSDYDYYDQNVEERSLDHNGVENDDGNIVSVTEMVTRESSWTRTEIDRLNNTVYTLKGEKVYTYYWQLAKIRSILRKIGVHMRSADFYVLGHQMCIQLYPNDQEPGYLGMQLRPSSNFSKKHRFTILDQFDGSKDINSQIFGGVATSGLYRVPYAKLEERNYLYNDAVIIKLTIYLNS